MRGIASRTPDAGAPPPAPGPEPRPLTARRSPVLPRPRPAAEPPPADQDSRSVGATRSLNRLHALVRAEIEDPEALIHQPVPAGRLWQAALSRLLASTEDQLANGAPTTGPATRPRPVKRAIDAMNAEPDRAFTVNSLAAVAGVSVRALQQSFRQHVGMPPMAYLRQLRLQRVHAELLAATPGQKTVASVAHRWGFTHLGRFAAAYRAEYGQPPTNTLHDRASASAPRRPAPNEPRHARPRDARQQHDAGLAGRLDGEIRRARVAVGSAVAITARATAVIQSSTAVRTRRRRRRAPLGGAGAGSALVRGAGGE